MRKRVWIPLTIVAVAALGFFGLGPGYLESSLNRVDGKPLAPISAEARAGGRLRASRSVRGWRASRQSCTRRWSVAPMRC